MERKNRDLRMSVARYMNENPNGKWTDIVKDLETTHNNTVHSAHGLTPIEAAKPESQAVVWEKLYSKYMFLPDKKPRFAVGDRVRLSKYKIQWAKESDQTFTTEVFVISKIRTTRPVVTYNIKDLNDEEVTGAIYENELIAAGQ